MAHKAYRVEKDSLGKIKVPAKSYWGAQTQRAIENFPISGLRFPREFIKALGIIKSCATQVNISLDILDQRLGEAIKQAAEEVIAGKFDDQFPVDIFQTGSGTSTNMNMNEVIANRANELLGGTKGIYDPVHPNDHVNLGQSSNDVIPSAIHMTAVDIIETDLLPSLTSMMDELSQKSEEFFNIIKIGRTHFQDAVPIRLGQEFSGYSYMISRGIQRVVKSENLLFELALGGTAVGTGINAHPEFAKKTIGMIQERTGQNFIEAQNHFEAQGARDALVEMSGSLKTVAVSIMKIAEDVRILSSGPRCGIGELILPEVQPGSSIMPGKINPVIPEAVIQVAAQVVGNDVSVAVGGMRGILELNVMMPVIAYNLFQSAKLISAAANTFTHRCIKGIMANEKRINEWLEKSLALITVLTPRIGYERASEIAREAYERGLTIREVLLEKEIIPEKEITHLLDPKKMV